jgi:hypothetical protein
MKRREGSLKHPDNRHFLEGHYFLSMSWGVAQDSSWEAGEAK